MGGVISGIMGGGKKPSAPDTSAIDAANARSEKRIADKEAEQAAEKSAKIRAARGRNQGRNLLANVDTGYQGVPSDTLGA